MTQFMAPKAVLVTGGARSGKSRFAEKLAVDSGLSRVYVATGAAHDDEMSARIAAHRAQRGPHWQTVEEQVDLAGVLEKVSREESVVLVDCLTLWLSNLMFAERDIAAETDRLASALAAAAGPVVLVTNEVGLGIVPENRLARSFRDAQGRLNQDIAAVCGRVVLVAAGQPLLLKPASQPDIAL